MKRFKYINLLIIILFLFSLGIGYAQISGINLEIDGDASLPGQDGIIISDIHYSSCNDMTVDSVTINTYYQSVFTSHVELGSSASSFITLQVTILNLTNDYYIFDGLVYDISNFYSNTNIVPSLTGITENTTILSPSGNNGDEITFNLTFSYDNGSNITNQTLDSTISFHFTPMVTINYQNCTNSAGQTSEKIRNATFTNTAGNTYSPTVNLGSSAPSGVVITNTAGTVTLVENTDYTYTNGIITFLNTLTEDYVVTPAASTGTVLTTYITNLIQNITPDTNGIYTAVSQDNSCTNTFAYDNNSNLRYIGSSPCNYVKFNCDSNGNNCELWRMIGVMTDVDDTPSVKMVRSDLNYSGTPWNTVVSNTWETSSLYSLLNTTLLPTMSDSAMIQSTKWNIGGIESNFTVANFYTKEHASKSTAAFKVGVFSPADYGYATSGGNTARTSCVAAALNRTEYTMNCRNNNWFYTTSYYQWTIMNKPSSANNQVYYITTAGMSSYATVTSSSFYYNLRPCVYLETGVKVKDGDGSTNHPYELFYQPSP